MHLSLNADTFDSVKIQAQSSPLCLVSVSVLQIMTPCSSHSCPKASGSCSGGVFLSVSDRRPLYLLVIHLTSHSPPRITKKHFIWLVPRHKSVSNHSRQRGSPKLSITRCLLVSELLSVRLMELFVPSVTRNNSVKVHKWWGFVLWGLYPQLQPNFNSCPSD